MKILIVGSTGMLGNTLKEYLKSLNINFTTLDRKQLDLSNCTKEELENKIVDNNCDVLINCAGLIKQRKNLNTSDFISVNSLLPHRLSDICVKYKIKMIHITTDCVFDGKEGNYNENSPHNVSDIYGVSKSMGEPSNCTVIRTSIIGEEVDNKLSLLEWVRSNKNGKIKGYRNHLWNGLTCLQLSKTILQIIELGNFWEGVRHIFSNNVTKYDLVNYINKIYSLNIEITEINDTYEINRTLTSVYDVNQFVVPSIEKQIEETMLFHKKM